MELGFFAIERPKSACGLLLVGVARNTLNRRGLKSNTPARKVRTMPRVKKPVVQTVQSEAGSQPAVSKSQAVRDYLKQHRGALPVAVSEALKAQGIDVTPNQVSNIKYQMGLKKKGRRKAAAPEAAAAEAPVAKDAISLSALLEAKKLVAKLGSTEAAKKAILALAQLGD